MLNAQSCGIIDLFLNASIVVKLVIIILAIASMFSWAIAIEKYLLFRKTKLDINRFSNIFWSSKSFDHLFDIYRNNVPTNNSLIFAMAMDEWYMSLNKKEKLAHNLEQRIDRAINKAINQAVSKLETKLSILANIGSVAPFIGLFGTVVGIMSSFSSIATAKNTSLAVVAPGISEALLATAIGLVVAIPSVIIYNKLTGEINNIVDKLEFFGDDLSNIFSRKLASKSFDVDNNEKI